MIVCEEHGDDTVVVYRANAPRLQQCPLCAAAQQIGDLEDDIVDLKSDLWSSQAEINALNSTISALESR